MNGDGHRQSIAHEFALENPSGRARRYSKREEPLHEDFFGMRFGRLRYRLAMMLYMLLSFVRVIFSLTTLFNAFVGVGCWAAYYYTDTPSDLPISLLSAGIVLPVSFGIGFNSTRRENLLKDIATVKAASLATYKNCRDLITPSDAHDAALIEVKRALAIVLIAIRQYLVYESSNIEIIYKALDNVQIALKNIADCDEGFRLTAANARIQTSFRGIGDGFERALVIHNYRTPASLRAFAFVFLGLFSSIFAPLFAKFSLDNGLWSGIYCSLITSIMFSSLYRILLNSEDPLDGVGPDDLALGPLSKHSAFMYAPKLHPVSIHQDKENGTYLSVSK